MHLGRRQLSFQAVLVGVAVGYTVSCEARDATGIVPRTLGTRQALPMGLALMIGWQGFVATLRPAGVVFDCNRCSGSFHERWNAGCF